MRYTRPGTRWARRLAVTLVTALMLVGLLTPAVAVAAPAQSRYGEDEWARVYTVRPGDSLAEIAMQVGVTQEALMRANGIRNANLIYVGQQLVIPEMDWGMGTGGPECADYYTVHRGDTLSSIALFNGLETWALARANGIYDLNEIYVGQTLCIPGHGDMPMQGEWREPEPERGWDGPAEPDWSMPGDDHGMYGPVEPDMYGPVEPDWSMPADNRGTGGPVEPDWSMPADNRGMDGPVNPDRGMGGPVAGDPDRDGPVNPDRGQGGPMPEPKPGEWMGPDQPGGPEQGGPSHGGPMRADEYWKGTYFNDKYFAEFALERKDLDVNFNWFTGSPFSDMAQDRFSVRWEKIEYFKGGHYRFFAIADDGVRVLVDDQTIIDAWKIQPATEYKADLFLGEGLHKLVVEYYEEAEDAQIRVYWEPLRK